MFIRPELGGKGTGCLFQFTYCDAYSMTFLPIFGNLRKMCALDFYEWIKSQFLDSLMDKRLPLHSNDVGLSPVAFHFFSSLLLIDSLLVFIRGLCRHGYIYLNLAYIYSTNTHVET